MDGRDLTMHQPAVAAQPTNRVTRIASSRAELTGAFELIQQRYEESGLSRSGQSLRITRHQLVPSAQIFVTLQGNEVIGTATLVRDSPDGLPIDDEAPETSKTLRQRWGRLAEVTGLAIRRGAEFRARTFIDLTSSLAAYARQLRVNRLIGLVHPAHAKLYQRLFSASRIGGQVQCQSVSGAPGITVIFDPQAITRCAPQLQHHYHDSGASDRHSTMTTKVDEGSNRILFTRLT